MDKNQLRAILKHSRENLSAAEMSEKSQALIQRALDVIDWNSVKSLHIYSSVQDWREPDTQNLVRKISAQWPQIKIVQPPLSRENPIPAANFDVIIVPTLGFDIRRNRIGLGGGWYDKFLATQPDALKVGLAYESGFIKSGFHTESHDIALDKIITEAKIY